MRLKNSILPPYGTNAFPLDSTNTSRINCCLAWSLEPLDLFMD